MHIFFFSKANVKTAATIALVSIGSALAQFSTPTNARVDALAGARVNDISGIYRYPVLMTGYLDHVQATWNGGDGAFVGVKSVTDMFSIGVLANQGPMSPEFTAAAVGRLMGPPPPPTYPSLPQATANYSNDGNDVVIPHLLLGFDFGAAAVGVDAFFEYGGYSASADDTTKYSSSISNPGFRLSGKFGVSDAEIMAKFGIGFPSISGEGPSGADKLTSDKGSYIEAGAEANIPAAGVDWILGGGYTQAGYLFKLGGGTEEPMISRSRLNIYAGIEFNFVETAVAALGYSIDRNAVTRSNPSQSDGPIGTDINYTHDIYAGVENAWEKAWIFDSFQLRGGALYTISATGGVTENQPAGTPNVDYSQPSRHGRVRPRIGIGVSKAFATFDVSVYPAEWGGLFTGPDVAVATGTVKF